MRETLFLLFLMKIDCRRIFLSVFSVRINPVEVCRMKLCSFQELQNRFEVQLEQAFQKWHTELAELEAKGNVQELYYLTRYRLPEMVQSWVQEEAFRSGGEVAELIRQMIASEEHNHRCQCCEHHREVFERVQMRLDNLPMVENPVLGPNHLFNQAFGAFGLIGGGIYVGTSYFLHSPAWFETVRMIVSLTTGVVVGWITYRKYHRVYRQEFRAKGEHFLNENQRRIREWFEQIISFGEGEITFEADERRYLERQ